MGEQEINSESTKDAGFWQELWYNIRLVYYLLRDPEVPLFLKLLPFIALVYILLPFDLLPDMVPVVGQLDDITILLVGAKVFIELAPPDIVERYLNKFREGASGVTFVEGEAEQIEVDPDANIIEGTFITIDEDIEDQKTESSDSTGIS